MAAKLRDEEKLVIKQMEEERLIWIERQKHNKIPVSVEDVYNMVSISTGVPIHKLDISESNNLLKMEEILSAKVIGQDDAISTISRSIRRNRVGIKDSNKPIGSFIFLGSTGVGKTYLAKMLAEILFGDPNKIIRIDMSEFMERHTISKLIGSPPGYVGYDEGGQLTEKIKNNPFSVILLDEIEKAHKDVFNILLQVLDEGHLTDSFGRKVNFTNTLIIMTSNIGARKVEEYGSGMGFSTISGEDEKEEMKKSIIQKELKHQFNPEFLNRVDDIIMFKTLNNDVIKKIITIELGKLIERLNEKNYQISFDESINDKIFTLNSTEKYGARPIKRIIQNLCEDFLSEEILKGNIVEKKQINIGCLETGNLFIKKTRKK